MAVTIAAPACLMPISTSVRPYPARKKRKCVQKSFSGCATCKARKIKCDEKKPYCIRCIEKGKSCPGFPVQLELRWSRKHELRPTKIPLIFEKETPLVVDLSEFDPVVEPVATEPNSASHIPDSPEVIPGVGESLSQSGYETSNHKHQDEESPSSLLSSPRNDAISQFRTHSSTIYEIDRYTCNITTEEHPDFEPLPVLDGDVNSWDTLMAYPSRDVLCDSEAQNQSVTHDESDLISLHKIRSVTPADRQELPILSDQSSKTTQPMLQSYVALPIQIHDLHGQLVNVYFSVVCPIFSTFDSQQNLFRSFVCRKWQNSTAMFFAMLSMAAGKLARRFKEYKFYALEFQSLALRHLQEDISDIQGWTHEHLMVVLMLGLSTCWHNTTDLGLVHLKAMQHAVSNGTIKDSDDEPGILDFFSQSLIYWEMVTSFVTDTESSLASEQSQLKELSPKRALHYKVSCSSISSIKPHPWTSVASTPQRLFTRIVRLIRQLHPLSRGSPIHPDTFLRSVSSLEDDLWSLQLPALHEIANTGDENTPAIHHLLLAESYMFANCYQLYHKFPNLWQRRLTKIKNEPFQLGSTTYSWMQIQIFNGSSPLQRGVCSKDWLDYFGRNILIRLEQISVSSRTSCVQPLLLLVGSTSLASHTDSGDHGFDRETSRMRKFVLNRLSYCSSAHYSEPTENVERVVAEIFNQLDVGVDVFWLDILHSMRLVTIIG